MIIIVAPNSVEELRVLLCQAVLDHSADVKNGEHGHATYAVVYELINDLIARAKKEGTSSP